MKGKLNICLVSDFFLPQVGGVEVHIYQLGKYLHPRGHRVIIVTHKYEGKVGVRWLEPGIKVYYLPHFSFGFNTIMPSWVLTLPIAREILIRQEIDITHSHQASSVLAGQFLSHARLLGIRTIHTQHSLFGFSDMGAISLYKVARVYHTETDRIICVSRTTRQNFRLRTQFPLQKLVVLPNAINMVRSKSMTVSAVPKLVSVGRLFYRKGIDLLVDIIPQIVKQHPDLQWTIIGDGPKKYLLEHIVKKYRLEKNIKLLGRVQHYLVQGIIEDHNIYVNTSLTQSFGIAVLEAAALGLICVTTNVGAVHQIMPNDELILVQCTPQDILAGVNKAIQLNREGKFVRRQNWSQKYSWKAVGDKVEELYYEIRDLGKVEFKGRVKHVLGKGSFSYFILFIMIVVTKGLLMILDVVKPRDKIPKALQLKTQSPIELQERKAKQSKPEQGKVSHAILSKPPD